MCLDFIILKDKHLDGFETIEIADMLPQSPSMGTGKIFSLDEETDKDIQIFSCMNFNCNIMEKRHSK